MSAICSRCSAPLPAALGAPSIQCSFCGTRHTPSEPQREWMAHLDFRTEGTPGFRTLSQPTYLWRPGVLEARMETEHRSALYTVLRSHGVFDNVDLSVTLSVVEGRLPSGEEDGAHSGVSIRLDGAACYVLRTTIDGKFALSCNAPTNDGTQWDSLVGMAPCEALRTGLGAENRLRLSARGPRLRAWLNGQLVASVQDDRLRQGRVEVLFNPRGASATLAIQELVLAEPA